MWPKSGLTSRKEIAFAVGALLALCGVAAFTNETAGAYIGAGLVKLGMGAGVLFVMFLIAWALSAVLRVFGVLATDLLTRIDQLALEIVGALFIVASLSILYGLGRLVESLTGALIG